MPASLCLSAPQAPDAFTFYVCLVSTGTQSVFVVVSLSCHHRHPKCTRSRQSVLSPQATRCVLFVCLSRLHGHLKCTRSRQSVLSPTGTQRVLVVVSLSCHHRHPMCSLCMSVLSPQAPDAFSLYVCHIMAGTRWVLFVCLATTGIRRVLFVCVSVSLPQAHCGTTKRLITMIMTISARLTHEPLARISS